MKKCRKVTEENGADAQSVDLLAQAAKEQLALIPPEMRSRLFADSGADVVAASKSTTPGTQNASPSSVSSASTRRSIRATEKKLEEITSLYESTCEDLRKMREQHRDDSELGHEFDSTIGRIDALYESVLEVFDDGEEDAGISSRKRKHSVEVEDDSDVEDDDDRIIRDKIRGFVDDNLDPNKGEFESYCALGKAADRVMKGELTID